MRWRSINISGTVVTHAHARSHTHDTDAHARQSRFIGSRERACNARLRRRRRRHRRRLRPTVPCVKGKCNHVAESWRQPCARSSSSTSSSLWLLCRRRCRRRRLRLRLMRAECTKARTFAAEYLRLADARVYSAHAYPPISIATRCARRPHGRARCRRVLGVCSEIDA